VAKKKSRVPTPPRKVDAPKPRKPSQPRPQGAAVPGGSNPGRTRVVLIGLGAVIAVAVVAVVLVNVLGGGEDASAALANAGCTEQTFPSQGRQHVLELKEDFQYSSFPPTSGPHNPQWALWGMYDRPVPFISSTHNLEHGGIVVQYGKDVPQETIAEIRAWYEADPAGLLVAPLRGNALPDKVALTGWTQLAICPGFDAAAFDSFRDQYRFKGPERIPIEGMQPGT
jgi:hypothetical protein